MTTIKLPPFIAGFNSLWQGENTFIEIIKAKFYPSRNFCQLCQRFDLPLFTPIY